MIPQNITHNHILKALDEIDELGYHERRESTGFYLRYEKKKYPPTYIIFRMNRQNLF